MNPIEAFYDESNTREVKLARIDGLTEFSHLTWDVHSWDDASIDTIDKVMMYYWSHGCTPREVYQNTTQWLISESKRYHENRLSE